MFFQHILLPGYLDSQQAFSESSFLDFISLLSFNLSQLH